MGRRRKPRDLTQDDRALWQRVADTTIPLHRAKSSALVENIPNTVLNVKKTDQSTPYIPQIIRPAPYRPKGPRISIENTKPIEDLLRKAEPEMDRRRFEKLRKGKLAIDNTLDLHGMTAERAHMALNRFILASRSMGARVVLVITGKGRQGDADAMAPHRHGVLRHAVPHWLRQPPLTGAVLQITPAHRRHGGTGAYYVYLRRIR